jgi:hypothetical protein
MQLLQTMSDGSHKMMVKDAKAWIYGEGSILIGILMMP